MPIETKWFLDGYILYVRYSGEVISDDLLVSTEAINKSLPERKGHMLHILVDGTDATKFSFGVQDLRNALQTRQEGIGWIMAVLPPSGGLMTLGNMFGSFTSQLFGYRYRSFASIGEVISFIREQDNEVGKLLADRKTTTQELKKIIIRDDDEL